MVKCPFFVDCGAWIVRIRLNEWGNWKGRFCCSDQYKQCVHFKYRIGQHKPVDQYKNPIPFKHKDNKTIMLEGESSYAWLGKMGLLNLPVGS